MKKEIRKQVLFVGNCNAHDLSLAFSAVDDLSDDFEFHHLALHATPSPSPEIAKITQEAHAVFIQNIAEAEKFRDDHVPNHVQCFGYPNLMRRALWPFDGLVYGRDTLAEEDAAKAGYVRFPDGLLGKLRTEIPNPEERFVAYRDLKVRGINRNFSRLLEMEDELLTHIDGVYGCRLGQFVKERTRTDQLFHWLGHPSGLLYAALMNYCCEKLQLPSVTPPLSVIDGWSTMQVPIHPLVAEQLGLEWASPGRLYNYAPFGIVTWEQYVRYYIRFLG
ncbi:WcbI family polysaccharide biosynthesis putative acetyltransferase [Methylobacterium sp. CM6257]